MSAVIQVKDPTVKDLLRICLDRRLHGTITLYDAPQFAFTIESEYSSSFIQV